jgi:hypothetical protein
MSGFGVYLLRGFNGGEVLRRCVGCGRFVVVEPPRGGKSFLIEGYLRNKLATNALVEDFTLRRSFINEVGFGGVNELNGWLAIRQHDSIEEAVEELLNCIVSENEECKDLGSALKPWIPRTVEILNEVSRVGDVDVAI